MKVFKLLVKIFFLATVITTTTMSCGITNKNITYNSIIFFKTATMSCSITNNNVMYNSIVFCLQKHLVHSRTWLRKENSKDNTRKADAFEDWASIHGAASPKDRHMNGLIKMQTSHLVGIYGSGEPDLDFSLNSTIQNFKDIVQHGEEKKYLDDSQQLIIKMPNFPAIVQLGVGKQVLVYPKKFVFYHHIEERCLPYCL